MKRSRIKRKPTKNRSASALGSLIKLKARTAPWFSPPGQSDTLPPLLVDSPPFLMDRLDFHPHVVWTEYFQTGILYEELVLRDWTVSLIAASFVSVAWNSRYAVIFGI